MLTHTLTPGLLLPTPVVIWLPRQSAFSVTEGERPGEDDRERRKERDRDRGDENKRTKDYDKRDRDRDRRA